MKAIVVVALLVSFFAVHECSLTDELKSSLLTGAHRCCISSCSVDELSMLRSQMETYIAEDGVNALELKEHLEASLSGERCASHSNGVAKRANVATISCPIGPYDVANGQVSFDCVQYVSLDLPILYVNTYAYVYYGTGQSASFSPSNGYYSDGTNATRTLTRTVTFTLPRYAPFGNYTVYIYAYSFNYITYVTSTGVVTVKKTVNDVAPPTLVSIDTPVISVNDTDKHIVLKANDDLSGIYYVYAYLANLTTGANVAYGYYYTPYINNAYAGVLNLSAGIPLTYYYTTPIIAGTYGLVVQITDIIGASSTYSTATLKSLGFQWNVTIAASGCVAGRYRPYGSTAACTLCAVGTFSNDNVFRCRACLPGTTGNAAGASSCASCPAGTSGIGGSWACSPCAAGTYSYTTGTSVCYPCQPGTNSTAGSSSCTGCPAGTYSSGGKSTCTTCPVATFSSGYSSYCQPCHAGTYGNAVGTTSCTACPANTFSVHGATACTACPAAKPKGPPGSNSQLNCYA